MISRSTPPPNGGSSSITSSIGTSVVRRARSVMRSSAARDVLAARRLRPQRADRAARFDHVRARQVDGGVDAACATAAAALAGERCAACSCIRMAREALRQRVVDVARDAVALFEHGLAPLFEPALFGEPALMQAPASP